MIKGSMTLKINFIRVILVIEVILKLSKFVELKLIDTWTSNTNNYF